MVEAMQAPAPRQDLRTSSGSSPSKQAKEVLRREFGETLSPLGRRRAGLCNRVRRGRRDDACGAGGTSMGMTSTGKQTLKRVRAALLS